jgi:hypothetical protein
MLALAVLLGVLLAARHLGTRGYLPQPFFFDPSDALMDLYNPAYWAHRDGVYDVWRAVYPPLSFVFLRLTTLAECYAAGPFAARACDWLAKVTLLGFWAADVALAFVVLRRRAPGSGVLRAIALGFGLPMLSGLDRGNLVIVTFCFYVLGTEKLIPSAGLRWLAMAIAINFKPYLGIQLIPLAVDRQWRSLAGLCAVIVLVYVISLALQGSGSPAQLLSNSLFLMAKTQNNVWNNLYNATSYGALIDYVRSRQGAGWGQWIQLLRVPVVLGQLGVVACILLSLRRPKKACPERLSALTLSLILSSFGASGYSGIFLVFAAFQETWRGWLSVMILVSAYLLCLPADWVISPIQQAATYSYWGGVRVTPEMGLALGQLLRPGLIMLIQFGFIGLTMRDLLSGSRRGGAGEHQRAEPAPQPAI